MKHVIGKTSLIACCILSTVVFGSENDQLAKSFFRAPTADRTRRFQGYSLEEQFAIFRYGNDRIDPPCTELADPIAARGAAAIPFLTRQLETSRNDIAVRDIALIFETMASSKVFHVNADQRVMNLLTSKVNAMHDKEWQSICQKMIERIRRAH